MKDYSHLKRVNIEIREQIAHVNLDHGEKHNALDMAMFYAIRAAIKQLKKDKHVRAVIVKGNGEDFCSGLDIKSVKKSWVNAIKLLFKWLPWQANLAQYVSTGWRSIPVPVIIAIQGRCWGGGLQIALGGDFRVASPDASLSIMEARWGLIPDMGGTIALKELIKLDVAKELAMTGKEINGEQAFCHGLITHIDNNPAKRAIEIASSIVKQSPDTIAAVKSLYNKSWWSKPGFALIRETYYQIKIILGKNFKIKTYNQSNQDKLPRKFTDRKNW